MRVGKYLVLSQDEYLEDINKATTDGADLGGKLAEAEIEDLQDQVKNLTKKLKEARRQNKDMEDELRADISRLETKVDVLEAERADATKVITDNLKNEDKEALLKARKESLDELTASLRDREGKLASKEEGRYKEGYADGVADGVRKISEITQKDRDNSMKVAMVAAASHTPTANLKELNNVHQLTEGTSDSKDK